MARGKIQMRRIENPVHRQVSFCKRRAGLLKKAKELSVLCDAEIGLFIFSSNGKLYEMASKGNMQGLIERYMQSTGGAQPDHQVKDPLPLDAKEEVNMLKQEVDMLQKGLRYMLVGGASEMTFDELLVLEKYLEVWIRNIRSTKMDYMIKEIQLLKKNEGILKAANQYLQDEMENVEVTNFEPMTTVDPYPLTIQDEINISSLGMYHV